MRKSENLNSEYHEIQTYLPTELVEEIPILSVNFNMYVYVDIHNANEIRDINKMKYGCDMVISLVGWINRYVGACMRDSDVG